METANKSEAERCLELAKKARDSGDVEKARRMAEKSLRLCYTQKAKGKYPVNSIATMLRCVVMVALLICGHRFY